MGGWTGRGVIKYTLDIHVFLLFKPRKVISEDVRIFCTAV